MFVRTLHRLSLIAVVTGAICPVPGGAADAADPLLPEDPLLQVQIAPVKLLLENPLLRGIVRRAAESPTIRDWRTTLPAARLRQAVTFLERHSGRSWPELLASLTTGGVELTLNVQGEPTLLAVLHGSDEKLSAQLVDLLVQLAKETQAPVAEGEQSGVRGFRIGPILVAAAGPKLLIGSQEASFRNLIDRTLSHPEPTDLPEGDTFFVTARLDLRQWRTLPQARESLKRPFPDGGQVALLGGWLDLLRRCDLLTARFELNEERLESRIHFQNETEPPPAELDGFFADAQGAQPAPLLILPETIASASWYRNYASLWAARDQLLAPEVVRQMEEGDAEAAAQLEALGSAVSLSQVAEHLGGQFRVVVAAQSEFPYDVTLRDHLPAAALIISLRNEESFRQIAAPLARVVHLILSFEQRMTSEEIAWSGTVLHVLSQPHTNSDVAQRDRSTYNFRPAHAITHGHLIVGSTPQIVRQTIDCLDAASKDPPSGEASGITSQQIVDVSALTAALERMRDGLVRRAVLQKGRDVSDAEMDLDVLLSVLALFERLNLQAARTRDGFEHRLILNAAGLNSAAARPRSEVNPTATSAPSGSDGGAVR